ncbi:MAG: methyltransferase domain-containing protein, partial [Ignavibacteriaceae bacterium]|nr:methyltransferase domain-containing protein [Ignavibacteriaceae bacterium]
MINQLNNIEHPNFWDMQYESKKTGWDLNSPNPVFNYLINELPFINPSKLIILGSGKGFDAVLANEKGYDVTAVDFSSTANSYCRELNQKFKTQINIIEKDFFELDGSLNGTFDIVYEYVTYCAISLSKRNQFLKLVNKLLKPEGRFITVLFPIDNREDGPPFSVDYNQFLLETNHLFNLEYLDKNIPSVKPR